jgi:hypothetical protein
MQNLKISPPSHPHAVEACRSTRPPSTQQCPDALDAVFR